MVLKVSHKYKWEGSRSCPLVTWFIFREQEGSWSSWYLAAWSSNYIFLGPAASDLSFCLHLFLWELGPRGFLSSTKVSDSGHTFYCFDSLLVIGTVIILWKVQVFSKWLVYFQRVGGYFSLLISLFPPTPSMVWELTIRDFTILECAGQGIGGHARGEWKSCIW